MGVVRSDTGDVAAVRSDGPGRGEPYTTPVDVLLLYTRGDEVLLALRRNTGYADEHWNLPSGKLEAGETVQQAMSREAREELGISLGLDDLQPVHVVHWLSPEGQGRLGIAFHVQADPARHGPAHNAEPHKCAELRWSRPDDLPSPTVQYSQAAVEALQQQRLVLTAGPWPRSDQPDV